MKSFLGKLHGLAATLALLRAYLRWAGEKDSPEPSKIDADDVAASIYLVQAYIIPMAQRTYDAFGGKKEIADAIRLLNVIKSKEWREFSQRDLQRALDRKISGVKELDAQLKELIALDVVRLSPGETIPKAGRPTKKFIVNPNVYCSR